MKRAFVFLVILFVLGSINVFGGGARSTGTSGSATAINRTGYPIVPEKITIRSALTGTVNMANPRILWEKLEELTNIRTEFFLIEDAQLAAFMAAGNWPDFFHSRLSAGYLNDYGVLGNRFVDYNTLLDYMPNLAQVFRENPMARKVVTEDNGVIYQVPYVTGFGVTSSSARLYYRADTLARYNLSVPRTLDEFYNVSTALRQTTGNAPLVTDMNAIELWFFPSFGEYIRPDFDNNSRGQVIFNRTSDQYRRYLTYLNRLYNDGLLHREFLTLDNATRLAMIKQGVSTFTGNEMNNTALEDFPSGEWDIGVFKPFTSQWNTATKVIRTRSQTIGSFAINARSNHTLAIARLLDIAFARAEVAPGTGLYGDAFMYGPENLTWRFTNAEKTGFEFIVPPGTTASVYQYSDVVYQSLGMTTYLNSIVTSEKSNNRARQLGFLENLNPNTTEDFFPADLIRFTADEQAVIDNRYTDIASYVSEMRAKFITGVENIDTQWDTYVRTINNMGIADVIRVYQTAYDRWNRM